MLTWAENVPKYHKNESYDSFETSNKLIDRNYDEIVLEYLFARLVCCSVMEIQI